MSQPQPIDPRFVSRPQGRRPKKRKNWFLRTVGLLLLLFVLMLVTVPLYAWSRIDKIDAMPTSGERPAASSGTTYLMVGSDGRENLSRAERARLHTGKAAGSRTDSIMLMHVPDSGPTVLVSIPRDSVMAIPGHGKNKVNAAFAYGKGNPALLIRTLENKTGLRIDHFVEVGFGGFASIIDSVGGIEMCLPKAMKDKDAHIDLKAGCQELDGVNALGYVRSRHADGKNDFGRVERQRQMVGAVAKKASSPSTFLNPVRFYNVATKGVDALTVDKEMGLLDFVKFAQGMRAVSGSGGVTLTVPIGDDSVRVAGGGVGVGWDEPKARALFKALKAGDTTGLKSS
ncbi:LCP family protein [Kribbella sandramycini]|uniref:LCP family protein n=1 Tax=Kribbella sandramycini TaxID=60450 RepID=A0A7Y4P4T0_9ACTN|nr:LCP family protein [Kribbella sandramycini]MBB6566758.1 LCP family protein required for cell wall assembly [Kribbella sandramycini]NOL45544.1 LCP family protein [Kribbella sandramycini]